jgi:UDP-N-acetylglucosamine--N-acetylmuramyl-(pentapeptide) pyrophosphoryl-undecaprenol N-acetylglucosamine transferase
VVTGNPVRPAILRGDAERGAARLGFDPGVPTLYVTGGAQGSHAINMAVRDALPALLECCQVLHQCGEGPDGSGEDLRALQAARAALDPGQRARYVVQAFVGEELGDVYALAALVLGRAGAGTVNELANLGKPSVLVPLPGATEQHANARALEKEGGAIVLVQEKLSSEPLTEAVCPLMRDGERLRAMGDGARKLARPGAADALVSELLALAISTKQA